MTWDGIKKFFHDVWFPPEITVGEEEIYSQLLNEPKPKLYDDMNTMWDQMFAKVPKIMIRDHHTACYGVGNTFDEATEHLKKTMVKRLHFLREANKRPEGMPKYLKDDIPYLERALPDE